MKTLFLFLFSCSLAYLCYCTHAPTAGGTTDTGNAKIAAVIYTKDGHRAAGASVVIAPSGWLPDISTDISSSGYKKINTITDDSGSFSIDSIHNGEYCIEVNDLDSSAILIPITISSEKNSTITLNDTLELYATVQGNAGCVSDTSMQRYLVIFGLDRIIPISADGSFQIDNLPGGMFKMRIISQNSAWQPFNIDSVYLQPTETFTIPFAGWNSSARVILNTSSSGADISENVYGFPLLLCLSSDNFSFSETEMNGNDLRFVKTDGSAIPFEIELWDTLQKNAIIWVRIDTVYGNNNEQFFTMLWGNPNAISLSRSTEVFDTANGFLGIYHFGGNLKDATSNQFDGENFGTISISDGFIGRACSFDGSSSYINLGDLPDRPAGTISCWFRPAVNINPFLAKTQGIWGKKEADSIDFTLSIRGIDFYLDSTISSASFGNLIAKQENPSAGYYLTSTTNVFSANTWYHLSWSWGNDGDSMYVNGTLENVIPYSIPVSGNGNDEIGRSLYDASNIESGEARYFYGSLDEFRIEKISRNPSWVKLCYTNQNNINSLVRITK